MVILYARVSTQEQAERELSLPAQMRALRKLAADSGQQVLAEYQDVLPGRSFKNRPGLLAAVKHATKTKGVEALLVHRIDRVARNMSDYLTIRAQLRRAGVRIISFVENFDEGPFGTLLENLMAAMSEFYSANLSMEVRKSVNERLARGRWPGGSPPLGYILEHGQLVLDPARASHVRWAFSRWASGAVTCTELANEAYARGLVNRRGNRISGTRWCDLLRSPAYVGKLRSSRGLVQGVHEPLVDNITFTECAAVFAKRRAIGPARVRRRFILSRLVICPTCSRFLRGEETVKPNGVHYRYYRCHTTACHRRHHADELEAAVLRLVSPGKRTDDALQDVSRIELVDEEPVVRLMTSWNSGRSDLEVNRTT